ncbi:Protein SPA1-RELATED 2 [Forsythia ovata]|uniref:Protein SPA1-RELATED 2 n=1 Tax=Forsythia ovata TaxID=205694 RepID=A0ABD1W412_9LAMI
MDEAVSDEVTEVGVDDVTHDRSKDCEFSLKPGSSSILEPNEMVMPCEDGYHENSNYLVSDTLDAKKLDRIGSSEHASTSPRCMDDAGIMVEELTVRNYDWKKSAVVGVSNNRDIMQTRQNQWEHLFQMTGGSGINSLQGQTWYKEKVRAKSSILDEGGNTTCPRFRDQQPLYFNRNAMIGNLSNDSDKGTPSDPFYPSGATRTKFLSKSGFSEYFIKSTLREEGLIHQNSVCKGSGSESVDHTRSKSVNADHTCSKPVTTGLVDSVAPIGFTSATFSPPSHGVSEQWTSHSSHFLGDGITLREWLEAGRNKSNRVESLNIFRQIVALLDFSHSQGVVLQDLRPSCFKLLASYQVLYLGSSVHTGITKSVTDQDNSQSGHNQNEKRPMHASMLPLGGHSKKKWKLGENMNHVPRWPQFPSRSRVRSASKNVTKADIEGPQDSGNDSEEEHRKMVCQNQIKFCNIDVYSKLQPLQACVSCVSEEKWYTSPELSTEKGCTFASNIYCLGVLLFELLGSFDSGRFRAAAMIDLRHRILPSGFLSENPEEAGYCLWLLHPEPSSRPTTREILQSGFVSGTQGLSGGELLSSIDEEDGESELLLYFLLSLKEQKQKDVSKLVEQIQCIEADIKEVEKRQRNESPVLSSLPRELLTTSGHSTLDVPSKMAPVCDNKKSSIRNIRQLESAYFSLRSNIQLPDTDVATHRDGELLKSRENWCITSKDEHKYKIADCLGGFFDGLGKYTRYNKFKLRGISRSGDFSNSANVICSLSFDRDEDYLAAGGVSKKIKIFEFQALSTDFVNFDYPVIEMANKSKLSCICWNSYIRNYLASSDYDGSVKLWDVATGQEFSHFIEHSERAWSVDFSRVDPTKLASGSDDRLKNSLCTIRNNANVCCVQFSTDSAHLLAFSSADYKIYCFDLRKVSTPWCILAGHEKAVSYAKFLDAGTLVSASTDNTLKIWDLSKTSSNFADGYIACGSETNEVFAYYKSLPMPITSHKFGSIDPISGKETGDDNGQFVSSVCWRRKSNMVVAANSTGCIKLLEIV